MKISELLQENELPRPGSKLPSAASLDDEPQDELDGEVDDTEKKIDDNQLEAIDNFKSVAKDLGHGLYAVAIFPDAWSPDSYSEVNNREEAINQLLKAFPEFNDDLPKEIPSEDLFVAIFNEINNTCGFAIASDEDYSLKETGFSKGDSNAKQSGIIGKIYSNMHEWAIDPTKEARARVINLLK
jgi:hypothetical protein